MSGIGTFARHSWGKWLGTLALAGSASACGGEDPSTLFGADGSASSIDLELTTVPTGAQCIRIIATPTTGAATTKTFAVTAGSASTNLQFTKVVPGTYTLAGDAFNVACTSIGTSAGDWTADPQPLTLRAGVTSSVTLTFRKNSTLAVTANFVNNVQSVGLGLGTSYVVTDGGLLESGLSSATRTFTRMSFTAFDTTSVPTNAIAALAAGYDAACAARQDGTVWCWGQNHFGELGPAGTIGSTSPTPLQVTGISAVTQIAAGAYHFCVIGKYGAATMPAVYCWGRGDRGQLGNGAMTSSATPQQANVLSTVRSIACGGDSTYLVDTTGAAFGWGYNGYGQLGDATTTSHSAPTAANRGLVQSIAGGDGHSCGLRFDGIVSCVGQNADGQLGNGTTMNTGASFAINGLVAKQVATGGFSTCAITTAGQTLCWGRGAEGEIGNGNSSGRTTPGPLAPDAPAFTSVAVGFQHACGLTAASDLYCWGANANGQVGDGTVNYAFVPVKAQLQ